MDSREFVGLISKLNTNEKAFSLGEAGNASGSKRQIKFDGESSFSDKYYPVLASASLSYGDRVLIANVGGSHVILGAIG